MIVLIVLIKIASLDKTCSKSLAFSNQTLFPYFFAYSFLILYIFISTLCQLFYHYLTHVYIQHIFSYIIHNMSTCKLIRFTHILDLIKKLKTLFRSVHFLATPPIRLKFHFQNKKSSVVEVELKLVQKS